MFVKYYLVIITERPGFGKAQQVASTAESESLLFICMSSFNLHYPQSQDVRDRSLSRGQRDTSYKLTILATQSIGIRYTNAT